MSHPRLTAFAALSMLLMLVVAAPAARAMTVEIIVFAHPGGAESSETWRQDPGSPDVSQAFPLSAESGVRAIGPNSYRMRGIWQALRGSPGYRPLRHVAWVQRGTSRAQAPVVLLGEGSESPVYGTVRVSRGRFLHIDVDLLYNDSDHGPVRFAGYRRMKSNEIHYMDHPLFGVLVVVSR